MQIFSKRQKTIGFFTLFWLAPLPPAQGSAKPSSTLRMRFCKKMFSSQLPERGGGGEANFIFWARENLKPFGKCISEIFRFLEENEDFVVRCSFSYVGTWLYFQAKNNYLGHFCSGSQQYNSFLNQFIFLIIIVIATYTHTRSIKYTSFGSLGYDYCYD